MLVEMIRMIVDSGFPPLEENARGQVCWYGKLYVAADIYKFISFHWNKIGPPSVLPSSNEC